MSENMDKVPFNCHACGVDFQLYHDGVTPQTIRVICVCGAENQWEFQRPPTRGIGFGFAAPDGVFLRPLPPSLRVFTESNE